MLDPATSCESAAGCQIHMLRGGAGPPLLFLHGKRGAGLWLPFFSQLAQRSHVIVPEHPGFGRSQSPAWLDTVADLANFYLELLVSLRLGAVHLVGHSLGGWIAAELAVRNTNLVATVTLIASAGIHVEGSPQTDLFELTPEAIASRLFADPALAARMLATRPEEDERNRQAKNARTFARLCPQRRLYDPQLPNELHRIDRPTLILWGDQDNIIPPEHGQMLHTLIPGSRLEMIEDCGHLPHIEKTGPTVAAITRFIEATV